MYVLLKGSVDIKEMLARLADSTKESPKPSDNLPKRSDDRL